MLCTLALIHVVLFKEREVNETEDRTFFSSTIKHHVNCSLCSLARHINKSLICLVLEMFILQECIV